MEILKHQLSPALGIGTAPQDFTVAQLCFRALIVCGVMYAMIRIAGRRFMAQKNAWDVLLAFVMASLLARAINGSTTFWENLVLGLVIAFVYRLIAWLACEFEGFGRLLKGQPVLLVSEGIVKTEALKKHHVSPHDLQEDLRLAGGVESSEAVQIARLERSGDISVIRKPQIVNIKVEDGIKTIVLRIQ
jgi:uncharacterized membrane protein YcaP (DUF421 family)